MISLKHILRIVCGKERTREHRPGNPYSFNASPKKTKTCPLSCKTLQCGSIGGDGDEVEGEEKF